RGSDITMHVQRLPSVCASIMPRSLAIYQGLDFSHCTTCKAQFHLLVVELEENVWRKIKIRLFIDRDVIIVFSALQTVIEILGGISYLVDKHEYLRDLLKDDFNTIVIYYGTGTYCKLDKLFSAKWGFLGDLSLGIPFPGDLSPGKRRWGRHGIPSPATIPAKIWVENIPLTFESEEHYFGSFVYLLLEEARFGLDSSMKIMHIAPFADMLSFNESTSGENRVYDVIVGPWKNQYSERGRNDYDTLPGDLLLLVDGKPESVSDLKRAGRTWALSMVKNKEDDSTSIRVKASQPIDECNKSEKNMEFIARA
nr:UvrD-like helicase, ATP-binding domain, P-loop containing nucleoside triphosphate hydrolase [Tanacetum cinerariifolium]